MSSKPLAELKAELADLLKTQAECLNEHGYLKMFKQSRYMTVTMAIKELKRAIDGIESMGMDIINYR